MVKRYACRKDRNHNEIAEEFQRLLWSWEDTHDVGTNAVPGFPDGIASKRGRVVFVEIKFGNEQQNDKEVKFEQRFNGDYRVVRTTQDVLAIEREYFGGGE